MSAPPLRPCDQAAELETLQERLQELERLLEQQFQRREEVLARLQLPDVDAARVSSTLELIDGCIDEFTRNLQETKTILRLSHNAAHEERMTETRAARFAMAEAEVQSLTSEASNIVGLLARPEVASNAAAARSLNERLTEVERKKQAARQQMAAVKEEERVELCQQRDDELAAAVREAGEARTRALEAAERMMAPLLDLDARLHSVALAFTRSCEPRNQNLARLAIFSYEHLAGLHIPR